MRTYDGPVVERRRYHHGNLRAALLDAAVTLADEGGPEAVTLRATARAAGVTPTAAYRHFAGHEELLAATRARALVIMSQALVAETEDGPPSRGPIATARRKLVTLGHRYVRFALARPGLFRTALSGRPSEVADRAEHPEQLLVAAVDELTNANGCAPAHKATARAMFWSTVHGLSVLLHDGALTEADRRLIELAIAGVVAAVASPQSQPVSLDR